MKARMWKSKDEQEGVGVTTVSFQHVDFFQHVIIVPMTKLKKQIARLGDIHVFQQCREVHISFSYEFKFSLFAL